MYMVIETQGSREQHDKEKLEAFLEVSGVVLGCSGFRVYPNTLNPGVVLRS
jgi:hypothetical protein